MKRNNDPFAQQLRSDAEAMTPTFSEALHQRTVRAMRQAQVRQTISGRGISRWQAGLAIAAGIALVVAGWVLYGRPESHGVFRPTELVVRQTPAGGLFDEPRFQQLLTPPAPPIEPIEQRMRSAAQYVASQFPPSLLAARQEPL